jgi:ketosteroid isomerase-like protein
VMNLESERAALMQTSRDWARTAASGDLERTLSFWSDDAIVMPPGQLAVVGKAAIREFLRQTSAIPGFSITWEPEQASVSNDADIGFMVERNRVNLRKPPVPSENSSERRLQCGAKTRWAHGSASSIPGTRIRPSGPFRCKKRVSFQPR